MADPASADEGRAEAETQSPPPAAEAETAVRTAPAQTRDLNARYDGLRGWLAELDRIVSIRTQVGLVLLALAVGAVAAVLYLAVDTRNDSASEAQLRELRGDFNRQADASADQLARLRRQARAARAQARGNAARIASLEARIHALQATPAAPTSAAGGGLGAQAKPQNGVRP